MSETWSFIRRVLVQGMAIQQDYAAGKYSDYEALSARLDAAARERDGQLAALHDVPADAWVPWTSGDPVPPPGEYVVTVRSDEIERSWTALCNALPADEILSARFDWAYDSRVVAYLPRPIPRVHTCCGEM